MVSLESVSSQWGMNRHANSHHRMRKEHLKIQEHGGMMLGRNSTDGRGQKDSMGLQRSPISRDEQELVCV